MRPALHVGKVELVFLLFTKENGKIVNITSINGLRGKFGQSNYAASKAGIIGFTKSLAKEVGPYNIRVNAVSPGFIETDMLDDLSEEDYYIGLRSKLMGQVNVVRIAKD